MKLKGRVAIVTGAGRGLGRASAMAMAKEGALVVIMSRTLSEIRETERLIKAGGGKVIALKGDVSKGKDVHKVVERALSIFDRIDILMNNAAIVGPVKPIYEIKENEWNKVLGINLKGALLFSRAVIPSMAQQRKGKIINVTSGLGEMTMPLFGAYSVAKAGLIHFTKSLSEEVKNYNIQVNGMDPGVMDTRMQDEVRNLGPGILGAEIYGEFVEMKKRGLLMPPEKIASLAVFLASRESNHITGENGTEAYYMRFGYKGPRG
jgi:3-oxoacyl-[acyl-carrier protein] reductase